MSYKARVFRVFIASPSDVLLEREITRNVLEQWNSINSEREKIVLVPIGWETNAAPEMGRPAQDYINMDILSNHRKRRAARRRCRDRCVHSCGCAGSLRADAAQSLSPTRQP